jgi:uncharacterized protein (DUF2147 family)
MAHTDAALVAALAAALANIVIALKYSNCPDMRSAINTATEPFADYPVFQEALKAAAALAAAHADAARTAARTAASAATVAAADAALVAALAAALANILIALKYSNCPDMRSAIDTATEPFADYPVFQEALKAAAARTLVPCEA